MCLAAGNVILDLYVIIIQFLVVPTFFAPDEKIHLYTSLLSLLTYALVTLICVLFSAVVIAGLSFPSFIMLSGFLKLSS